jgi:hypothetical protein
VWNREALGENNNRIGIDKLLVMVCALGGDVLGNAAPNLPTCRSKVNLDSNIKEILVC